MGSFLNDVKELYVLDSSQKMEGSQYFLPHHGDIRLFLIVVYLLLFFITQF